MFGTAHRVSDAFLSVIFSPCPEGRKRPTAVAYSLLPQVAWSTLEGTDGRVQVYRYSDGADSPRGTFTLALDGDSSSPIPWNASAAAVEEALEALPQLGDVVVTAGESSQTKATWEVEFTTLGTPANIGNLPLLEVDGSFLVGTAVDITVEEISTGCCTVEVSANGGADYTVVATGGGNNVAAFRYQGRAAVHVVEPRAGPVSGGTPLIISGTGFDLPSAAASGTDGEFVCVFGGRLESPATRLNSSTIACTSPATLRGEAGVMSVAVRWLGSVSPSATTAAFTYFEDVLLAAVIPRRGSNAGGFSTAVAVGRGSFAALGVTVTCAVEVRLPSNLTGGYSAREFSAPATALSDTPGLNFTAEVISVHLLNKEVYMCNMPGLGDFFPGVSTSEWLDHDWHAIALVSLSGNHGVNRTTPIFFRYVPRPTISAVEPTVGVDGGGTSVIVHGTGLVPPHDGYDDGELLCRFGHMTPVPAEYISASAVECISSPHTNKAAIMSVVVEGASVFHATQEVLLRIPFPMENRENTSSSSSSYSYSSLFGTWTLSLEGLETYSLDPNVTAAEMALALSELPNVGNVTVNTEHRSVDDTYAGLSWNETAFTVQFAVRDGYIPVISANTSDLHFSSTVVGTATAEESAESSDDLFVFPVLAPEASVRMVAGGHDGIGVVREVQVLRTNRSELSAETQTVTLTTSRSPTAEVSSAMS